MPTVNGYSYYSYYSTGLTSGPATVGPFAPTEDRFYGYFTAIERVYTTPAFGTVHIMPEISWIDILDDDIYILGHQTTSQPLQGTETLRVKHEWFVMVANKNYLPLDIKSVGSYDAEGYPQPDLGVYVRISQLNLTDTVLARYFTPVSQYFDAVDLLNLQDTNPISEFLIASAITQLQNYTDTPDPQIGYNLLADFESNFFWLYTRVDGTISNVYNALDVDGDNAQVSTTPLFSLETHGSWRPGKAGYFERFLMGSGKLNGINSNDITFMVYAFQHVIIAEFWKAGVLVTARSLNCQKLTTVTGSTEYVIGMGYDFSRAVVSLGVSARGSNSEIVYQEWHIPELYQATMGDYQINIGGGPVEYTDASIGNRSAWGWIQPVHGQFSSETYLTKGFLAQLMKEVQPIADL